MNICSDKNYSDIKILTEFSNFFSNPQLYSEKIKFVRKKCLSTIRLVKAFFAADKCAGECPFGHCIRILRIFWEIKIFVLWFCCHKFHQFFCIYFDCLEFQTSYCYISAIVVKLRNYAESPYLLFGSIQMPILDVRV